MELKKIKPIAAVIIAFSAIAATTGTSNAQSSDRFFCGASEDGIPTTFAQTVTGNLMPIIRWEKWWSEKYTPQIRCDKVSKNFQKAYEEGNLNYLVVSPQNGQSTICGSKKYGKVPLEMVSNEEQKCKYHLFTLRNSDDPEEIVKKLEDMGSRSTGILIQSYGDSSTFKVEDITWHSVQVNPALVNP